MEREFDVLVRRGLVSEWVVVMARDKGHARAIVRGWWAGCHVDAVLGSEDY